MAYIALYRKWRPQGFDALVGQDPIRRTLKNSVAAGRISHAYLFTGPRGTGKTSTAKILAKALNCQNRREDGEPCGICSNCIGIQDGSSMDVFEIDAASNRGIDQIRDLREAVKFAPTEGAYKVYIIDEVHMVTNDAFNAFLKTLEEPPSHVVFILATTEPQKIPATILSRCQRYDFRRITAHDIVARLEEVMADSGFSAEPSALQLIAVQAGGGLRDALSILDQAVAMAEGPITEKLIRDLLGLVGQEAMASLVDSLIEKNISKSLTLVEELRQNGQEPRQTLGQLLEYLRLLVLWFNAPGLVKEQVTQEEWATLKGQAEKGNEASFRRWLEIFLHESGNLRVGSDARLHLEMALAKVHQDTKEPQNVTDLVERIQELERRIIELESSGGSTRGASPSVVAAESVRQEPPARVDVKPSVIIETPNLSTEPQVDKTSESIKKEIGLQKNEVLEEPPKGEPEKPIMIETASAESFSSQSESTMQLETTVKSTEVSEDNEKVWQQLLGQLEAQNKRAIKACAEQGKLISLQNQQAVVAFLQIFPRDRLLRADFKKIIESLLSQIVGSSMTLQCVLEGETLPAATSLITPQEEAPIIEEKESVIEKHISEKVDEKEKFPKNLQENSSEKKSLSIEEAPKEVQSILKTLGIEEADVFEK